MIKLNGERVIFLVKIFPSTHYLKCNWLGMLSETENDLLLLLFSCWSLHSWSLFLKNKENRKFLKTSLWKPKKPNTWISLEEICAKITEGWYIFKNTHGIKQPALRWFGLLTCSHVGSTGITFLTFTCRRESWLLSHVQLFATPL